MTSDAEIVARLNALFQKRRYGPGEYDPELDILEPAADSITRLSARVEELERALEEIAIYAPTLDMPEGAWGPEPPSWSLAEEYGMHGDRCGYCGAWCSVVRPGKTQCECCGGDALTGFALRARSLLTPSKNKE